MMSPKDLKWWLFLLAIAYLAFPRDLIPDSFGRGIGLIDDFGLMGLLAYYFRRYARQFMAQQEAKRRERAGAAREDPPASSADPDPHAVLGIVAGASQEEIQAAYRARMREYHPDKVAHLGEDLQKLAHSRSLEIQQAYQRLRH